jgi:mannose/cellobiose epimerase-like protein (N-acyl-D-glucosamine 2-epimerase family)
MAALSDEQWAAAVRRELLEDILPFWRRHTVDQRRGGFIGWMSNDLRVQDDAPKGLILNARLLWTFSAAYAYTQDEKDRALARRAYVYLTHYFLDRQHGGYFWELDPSGAVRDDKKKVYGEAFCIYALAEYYRVFQEPAALQQAVDVFELIEARARDRRYGGYFEVMSRDWQPCADMRLSDKDMNEKKSMNNHLHVLEAYTNLLRVWCGRPGLASRGRPGFTCRGRPARASEEEEQERGQDARDTQERGQDARDTEERGQSLPPTRSGDARDPKRGPEALATSLRELIDIFRRHILNAEQTHFQHFFDEAWTPRSGSYTFGHDVEGSWLLCEAAEALAGLPGPSWQGRPGLACRGRPARASEEEQERGQDARDTGERGQSLPPTRSGDARDTRLMTEVQNVAVGIARAVRAEGLDKDGGLFYEGRDGRIINPNKEWWPQAEAVVGFYNAWQLTGDEAFREAAIRCWQFIEDKVVDHECGEWFWCLRPDGTPDPSQPKVSPWKGPYHNGRCCLEIIRRTRT